MVDELTVNVNDFDEDSVSDFSIGVNWSTVFKSCCNASSRDGLPFRLDRVAVCFKI